MREKNWIVQRFQKILEQIPLLIPYALIGGILDYRFHNFYWPELNEFRPLTGSYLFDFFSFYDFFMYAASIVIVIFILLKCNRNTPLKQLFEFKNKIRHVYLFLILFCLYITGIIFSYFFFSPVTPQIHGIASYLNTNYINPLVTFLILFLTLTTEQKIIAFTRHCVIAFSLLGLGVLTEYYTDILPGVSHDFLDRAVWPYIDPFIPKKPESANWLSYLFAPIFLMCVYRIFENKSSTKAKEQNKFVYFCGLIISLSIIFVSRSYAGLAATIVVFSLYFLKKTPSLKKRIALLVSGFLLIGIFVYTQKDSRKFQILLGNYQKENSIHRRVQIYTVSIQMLLEKPFKGLGPGNFQSVFKQNMEKYLSKPIPNEELPPHPHNLILSFWSELGIGGLFFIIAIYIGILLNWCKNKITIIGVLPLSYLVIHGVFDVPYALQEASVLFAIYIFLVVRKEQQISFSTIDAQKKV